MGSANPGRPQPRSTARAETDSRGRPDTEHYDTGSAARALKAGMSRAAPARAARERDARRRERDGVALSKVIAGDVIPRLLLAHRGARSSASPPPVAHDTPLPADATARFVALLIADDEHAAARGLDALLERQHGFDQLISGLLEPAARLLGEMWVEDDCCFSDVTVGLLRLQDLLRSIAARLHPTRPAARPHRRVALAVQPGDDHVFGLRIVAEYFAHAGWQVNDDLQPSADALVARMASEWHAVVGLSVGAEAQVGGLAELVRRLRDSSCNPDIGIMLGGSLVNAHPELVATVGADFHALDPASALAAAEHWCISMPVA